MRTNNRKPTYRKGAEPIQPLPPPPEPTESVSGFYFDQFNQGEIQTITQAKTTTLQQEIILLRVITRRLVEMCAAEINADAMLKTYRTIALICSRIASLQRATCVAEVSLDTYGLKLEDIQAVIYDAVLKSKGKL